LDPVTLFHDWCIIRANCACYHFCCLLSGLIKQSACRDAHSRNVHAFSPFHGQEDRKNTSHDDSYSFDNATNEYRFPIEDRGYRTWANLHKLHAKHDGLILRSRQRVRAKRGPMTGSTKQSGVTHVTPCVRFAQQRPTIAIGPRYSGLST
jgi:hypothetical protein